MASDAKYSDAPLATIDIGSLPPSRLLLEEPRLPYRDLAGRVNVHLLRLSAGLLTPSTPASVSSKLHKWLRHAERWEASRAWREGEEGVTSAKTPAGPHAPLVAKSSGHGVTEERRRVRGREARGESAEESAEEGGHAW